ncbi:MAG: Uma2 family endonuclease [Chloroflexi bacterium]|nr:Uma2 family endonuclease [Chloroflexota bacterium]
MVAHPGIEEKFVDEDEFMQLGSDALVEIVDGEIVEMHPAGGVHHFIGGNVHDPMKVFATKHQLGFVFMDGLLFHLFREGKRLKGARVPDVSFIRRDRIPKDWDIEKPFPGAPTLAVEVMSPDDDSEDVLKKVREYLAAGTEEVWVIYPKQREVHQFLHDNKHITTYTDGDDVIVSTALAGFSMALREIFALPSFE